MKVFLNGNIVEEKGASVSAISSGLYYGAGCFESMRSYSGKFLHFIDHVERLHSGLIYLGLKTDQFPHEQTLRNSIADVLDANDLSEGDARVRIQISLNEKGGYSKTDEPEFDTIITVQPHQAEKKPKRICTVQTRVIPNQCRPTNCKLSNMLHYRNAFREAEQKGFNDGLMLTVDDFISETSIANIFWKKGSVIYTPDKSCDFLPGIMRKIVLNILEQYDDVQIKKGKFRLDEIKSADEVFITNSVREISFVQFLDDKEFTINSSFSKSIQKSLENYKSSHLI
ncbi:MAG: aminotransferase class IV [Balneolaceae bacterium]